MENKYIELQQFDLSIHIFALIQIFVVAAVAVAYSFRVIESVIYRQIERHPSMLLSIMRHLLCMFIYFLYFLL